MMLAGAEVVYYTAVFSVVTQRSSPLVGGEELCVTTLKQTRAEATRAKGQPPGKDNVR